VQRAASFPDALQAALATLGDRIGAEFLVLLQKRSSDAYEHESLSLAANGVLVGRLARYPHPLPLTHGDYESWLRWARESKPAHVAEIERLRAGNVRMAMALRSTRAIVAVLLAGPSRHHRAFTEGERQVFSGAAEALALMIENARLNERALEQEKVRRDLALAAEVQRRLMPRQSPTCPTVSFAAFTLPARTVGGDYYDFLDLGGDRIGIAVADVSGKGIAAALLMSVVQASLRAIATEPDIASAALAARLNRFLYQSTDTRHYATFDAARGRLRYVNAGHNPPYLLRRNGTGVEVHDLSVGGMVIGAFDEAVYEEAEVDLHPGDLIVAFTDGVTEARDAAHEEFGEERLKQVLRGALGLSAEDVAATLQREMRGWIGGTEQHDDLTFVVAVVHDPLPSHQIS
jgi:sigma-B regulation protein RsbU (phosphoserine phosphatase)